MTDFSQHYWWTKLHSLDVIRDFSILLWIRLTVGISTIISQNGCKVELSWRQFAQATIFFAPPRNNDDKKLLNITNLSTQTVFKASPTGFWVRLPGFFGSSTGFLTNLRVKFTKSFRSAQPDEPTDVHVNQMVLSSPSFDHQKWMLEPRSYSRLALD